MVKSADPAIERFRSIEVVRNWLNHLHMAGYGSINTERDYIYKLRRFCNQTELSPLKIIEVARKDIKKFENDIIANWWLHREKAGENRHYIVEKYAVLRLFLRYHDILLTTKIKKERRPRRTLMSKTDLRNLVDLSSPKLKSMLLFMRDSGLGPTDMLSCRYKLIKKDYETNTLPITLSLTRIKTKEPLITFLGAESIAALRTWLEYRERRLGRKLKDEDLLFPVGVTTNKTMTYAGFYDLFSKARNKAGLVDMDPYDLRRYFISQLSVAGMNAEMVEYLVGHSLGANNSYLLPSIEQLRNEYFKHYSAITFEVQLNGTKVAKIEEEVEQLRKENEELKQERKLAIGRLDAIEETVKRIKEKNDLLE